MSFVLLQILSCMCYVHSVHFIESTSFYLSVNKCEDGVLPDNILGMEAALFS
jgi:hypothetical protein